ncbi:MAG TPA: hypothetical protein VK906_11700 [Egicoccus sp.]|nr:hypothetical protein [Egicoccus sp.]HSK23837.1 hypothetical protein [Egicoccus sp.]
MSGRRLAPVVALVLALTACGGGGRPVTAPTTDPKPTEDLPGDEAPVDEPLPRFPPIVADWETDVRVALPNGWAVEGCEGDAPLLCVVDDGRQVGFLELGGYPLPAGHDGDDAAYLAAAMADFVDGMRADRATGCPDLGFEAVPPIAITVGGEPGLRGGFRLVDDTGREVERHLLYWTVVDDQHVTVTVPAYAEDGCLAAVGEFTPEDLGLVALYLDDLVAHTPLPAAGGG